jgi:hypothetical protein
MPHQHETVPPSLTQVRFRFFGKGHGKPLTGHLYLRWVVEEGIWRISDWRKADTEFQDRKQEEGTDPAEGGKRFVEALKLFLEGWSGLQQEAIGKCRAYLSRRDPKDMVGTPGFRPTSAGKYWYIYKAETLLESGKIQDDVEEALRKLKEYGWIQSHDLVFPALEIQAPWALTAAK